MLSQTVRERLARPCRQAGRARKAQERVAALKAVDTEYRQEAENREEKERLSTAYYAKAAATRRGLATRSLTVCS